MNKAIAIDYGTKRCGLSITDEHQYFAFGYGAISTTDLIPKLHAIFDQETISVLVLGEPKHLNNEPSDIEQHIQKFLRYFEKKFPSIKVIRIDERFTSKMAVRAMVDGGMKKSKRKQKEKIDEISATLILQSYIEQKTNQI